VPGTVKLQCPNCQTKHRAPEEVYNLREGPIKCPTCQAVFPKARWSACDQRDENCSRSSEKTSAPVLRNSVSDPVTQKVTIEIDMHNAMKIGLGVILAFALVSISILLLYVLVIIILSRN